MYLPSGVAFSFALIAHTLKDWCCRFLPPLFIGALLFWRMGNDYTNAVWMERWTVLLTGAALGVVYYLRRIFPLYLLPLLLVVSLNCIWLTTWFDWYRGEDVALQSAVRQAAGEGFLCVLFPLALMRLMPWRGLNQTMIYLQWTGLAQALLILVGLLFGKNPALQVWGLDNPSMAASFVVLSLFLSFFYWSYAPGGARPSITQKIWVIVCTASIAVTGASTPMVALIIGLFTTIVVSAYQVNRREGLKVFGMLSLMGLAVGGVLYFFRPEVFSTSGRVDQWKLAMEHMSKVDWTTKLIGNGLGSTRVIFPILQAQNGADLAKGPWVIWLHNDWLQALFEMGILGLTAMGMFFGGLLRAALRLSPWLVGLLITFAVLMCSNFPMHYALHALCGFVIAALIIRLDEVVHG